MLKKRIKESQGGAKGQPPWWFITCLLSCFILLCFSLVWGPSLCVVRQCLSELDYGRFCFPQWLLWYSWFKHSSRTLLLCFWLTPQGLRFVCWLQMYTVAKHTVSVTTYIFLISVGDWLYFSGHGWRPLQISFESRCLWASCFRFSQMATRLCIKRPKMDLTFFKSCTLHLKHFEKIFSWRYQIMEHRYIELDTHWQKLLSRLLCGYSLCRQHSCHSIECNGEVCFSFGFSKTQVQANSIHIWESAFQSSI